MANDIKPYLSDTNVKDLNAELELAVSEGELELREETAQKLNGCFSDMYIAVTDGISYADAQGKLDNFKLPKGFPVNVYKLTNVGVRDTFVVASEQIGLMGEIMLEYNNQNGIGNMDLPINMSFAEYRNYVNRKGDQVFSKALTHVLKFGFGYHGVREIREGILTLARNSTFSINLPKETDVEGNCRALAFAMRFLRNGKSHPSDRSKWITDNVVTDFAGQIYPAIQKPIHMLADPNTNAMWHFINYDSLRS